jgi:hypothetical protein
MQNENLAKYHEFFIINLRILLNDIVTNVPDGKSVKVSAIKLIETIETRKLDPVKVGNIVRKIYTISTANLGLLVAHDMKLFQIKEKKDGRNVIITMIPGINIGEAYEYFNDNSDFWKCIENIFYASVKLLDCINSDYMNDEIKSITDKIEKTVNINNTIVELRKKVPDTQLVTKEDFNPFIGVGETTNNYSVNDMLSGPKTLNQNDKSSSGMGGIGSIASMMGDDKMLNLDKLTDELKNIDKKQIDDATVQIKNMMGGNVDENTSEMLNLALQSVTEQLKKTDLSSGNPLENIFKIADTVAQQIAPKIDKTKIDKNTVMNSMKELGKNMPGGNNIFGNFDMFTNMMKSQMDIVKDGKAKNKSQEQITEEQMKFSLSALKNMGNSVNENEFKDQVKKQTKEINKKNKKK